MDKPLALTDVKQGRFAAQTASTIREHGPRRRMPCCRSPSLQLVHPAYGRRSGEGSLR